ncbi:MAG: protein-L-isoaspartate(D-aspartate) O-methyltransferase [Candidatus Competibacteraceae bacterium]
MTSRRTRRRLVERLRAAGIRDERVLDVILTLPRHLFVDEALASHAYDDIALPIGFGQTISQPYIVARMTEALLAGGQPQRVLEIGTGSAYQSAVLALLVEQVYSVERIGKLLERARERLWSLALTNVYLQLGDGRLGWPAHAPYDGILVTAAAADIPAELLQQLTAGGRLVIPVGTSQAQELVQVERKSFGFAERSLGPVSFVPLVAGVS